jgi:hypothetical protein
MELYKVRLDYAKDGTSGAEIRSAEAHVAVWGDFGAAPVERAALVAIDGVIGSRDEQKWRPFITGIEYMGSVHVDGVNDNLRRQVSELFRRWQLSKDPHANSTFADALERLLSLPSVGEAADGRS